MKSYLPLWNTCSPTAPQKEFLVKVHQNENNILSVLGSVVVFVSFDVLVDGCALDACVLLVTVQINLDFVKCTARLSLFSRKSSNSSLGNRTCFRPIIPRRTGLLEDSTDRLASLTRYMWNLPQLQHMPWHTRQNLDCRVLHLLERRVSSVVTSVSIARRLRGFRRENNQAWLGFHQFMFRQHSAFRLRSNPAVKPVLGSSLLSGYNICLQPEFYM
jgi:hypothetical protein